MSFNQKFILLLARLAMGWLMLYAGFVKIIDPAWTAKTYIQKATLLPQLYSFFLRPDILPYVNSANKWGLALVGGALILGLATRFAAFWGIVLMALYFVPIYNPQSIAMDEHIIYALVFLLLMVFAAGRFMGLDGFLERAKFIRKRPWMGKLLG